MIKDRYFKTLLIPFLGLTIPMAAHLVEYTRLSLGFALFTGLYFIFVSQLIWHGAVRMQVWLRTRRRLRHSVAQKLSAILFINPCYGLAIAASASVLWQLVALRSVVWGPVITATGITVVAVIILTLIYESLFLSAEIDLDAKVMQQLEQERQQAESSILQNELDPHFLFNSLNALSYLVRADADKAYRFVHKLSNVFKYLLLNKQKALVPLEEELAYLDDYYFLLRVRFDDGVQIETLLNGRSEGILLLPCTLQALVENAIKHNFFSDAAPLFISIQMDKEYISVSNPVRPKPYKPESTNTGLCNLRSRYQLVMKKNILVQKTTDAFVVKIPFQKTTAVNNG